LEYGKSLGGLLGSKRPINRLVIDKVTGSGKAEVVKTPSQFSHILWVASKGNLGIRNVAIIWLLFGSGLRVNEVAHLKVKDLFYKNGSIKKAFSIPSPYTKTGLSRTVFLLAKPQVKALVG
jgi:integrase/recombinase XerD